MARIRSKKKKIVAFVLIFVVLPLSGPAPNGETPNKQPKMSCYFGLHRFGIHEKTSRTPSTAVSTKCGGDPVKMSTLIQTTGHGSELYGCFSRSDLAVTRGGAYYMKESEEEHWYEEYICPQHIKELITEWNSVTQKHVHHHRDYLCSWPFERHDFIIRGKFIHYVQREEARVYLLATGNHIHVGTPICYQHHREMTVVIESFLEKSSDPDFSLQVCTIPNSAQCSREEMMARKFFDFANLVGINRPIKDFSEYKRDTQRKKVDGVFTLQKWAVHYIAPGHEPELQAAVNARCSRTLSSDAEATVEGAMEMIGYEFLMAPTRRLRDYVLSLVAGSYPFHLISRFIPSLTISKYYRAKHVALSGNLHPTEIPRTLDRFDHEGLNQLIGFITSPHVMASHPYGIRLTHLSTGEAVEIPNTIRIMGHSEIIRQHGQSMREQNMENHLLSDSSIHRILRALPADQRHAETCVDKTKAKAFYAFEDWLTIQNRMLELTHYTKDEHSEARYDILEVQLYLRTDFPLHLKEESLIADHCLLFALSDPDEPDFRITLSHDHDNHQCPRCNHMMKTLTKMEAKMKDVVDKSDPTNNKELREMQFRIKTHTEDIWELKFHEVRSVFTDLVLSYYKSNVKEGVGLLIIDYANKWEPMWFMEPQEEFFAKAGDSWHFGVLITKIGDQYVSHTFIHLNYNGDQNSACVVSILEHILRESKKMGVHTFDIRSDNGASYHSAMTLGSIQYLARITTTTIRSWSFSEQQHGKSDCDRKIGGSKTKIRSYVHTGKNVLGLRDMLVALSSGRLMRGTSIHLVTTKKPTVNPDEAKLPQISNYGHFEFTADTIRVWKYKGIGPGRIVDNMQHIEVSLQVHAEDGHLADSSKVDEERRLVENRIEARFWLNDNKRKDDDEYTEEYEDRDDDAAADTPSGPSNPRDSLHYCWCGSSFMRFKSLLNHLEWGKHRIIPEKVDMIDLAIGTFKSAVESISNLSPLLPLKDAVNAIFDSSIPIPEEGFAMKKKRKGGRLPAEPRKFIVDYYERVMREGQRPDANEALRLLTAVDSIPPEVRLTYAQIKRLFSRLSKTPVVGRARRHTFDEEMDIGEWEQDWDEIVECKQDLSRIFYKTIMSDPSKFFDMTL